MQPRAFLCFYVRRRIRILQHTVQREDILMLYCGLEFKMFKMVDKMGILSFGGQEMSGNVGKCGPIVCFEFWFAMICWCL